MKQDLESYQKSVQQSQQNQLQPKEQSTLTCSEHSVFGKFDAFCARLRKILRLYDVIDKHESLLKSRMEGLLQEEEGLTVFKLFFDFLY
jgi:dynein heavy chain